MFGSNMREGYTDPVSGERVWEKGGRIENAAPISLCCFSSGVNEKTPEHMMGSNDRAVAHHSGDDTAWEEGPLSWEGVNS
jgi:hypothetical protein